MAPIDQNPDLEAALYGLDLTDSIVADQILAHLTHPEPDMRELALHLLRQSLPPPAIGILLPLLGDPVPNVRAAAITTIAQHPAKEVVVDALIKVACDSDTAVRRNAIWELGQIGHPRALPTILAGFYDQASIVREVAIVASMNFGSLSILAQLELSLRDPVDAVRQAASFALDRLSQQPQP